MYRARYGVGREVRAIILKMTYCITLLHISIFFRQAIPYGYLVMACTRKALEIYRRDVTLKQIEMGSNHYICDTVP